MLGLIFILMFQSLGRDSVGWDHALPPSVRAGKGVSIPRSGFCGVGRAPAPSPRAGPSRFNPSVGILWGGTSPLLSVLGATKKFQSLGRDSVGWDRFPRNDAVERALFQSLGRDSVGWDLCLSPRSMSPSPKVSIPRSGFCGVGRKAFLILLAAIHGFNPSVGILWGGTAHIPVGTMPVFASV